jgi:pre-mRNA-splicing factor SYF1
MEYLSRQVYQEIREYFHLHILLVLISLVKGGEKVERARDLFEQALEKCPPKSCKPIFLMYAQFEEEHGLAKRAMAVYDRATQIVKDEDKFEVRALPMALLATVNPFQKLFTIYIAKAAANYGLTSTRPIYERALEILPDRQTAEMCLRFAQMERKLGEIDRARAIYAHASQFCDPRINQNFWAEWNSFEIETGSEDTFREMLRIKRSVQAQFNTEVSYIAAQMASKQPIEDQTPPADAMAAAERQAGGTKGPAFVAAKENPNVRQTKAEPEADVTNADEIHISDEEDI